MHIPVRKRRLTFWLYQRALQGAKQSWRSTTSPALDCLVLMKNPVAQPRESANEDMSGHLSRAQHSRTERQSRS